MIARLEAVSWMLDQVASRGVLSQHEAAHHLLLEFGDELAYLNDNGSLVISPRVLAEFRKETGEHVVWDRHSRQWRIRAEHDAPGRQQNG